MILEKLLNKPSVKQEDIGPRFIPVPQRRAGVLVTHDNALEISSVFACVRVISEDIAALPWNVFNRRPDGSKEKTQGNNIDYVLNRRPNPEISPIAFRETLIAWALIWGNGYAEIVRDQAGRIAELYPISPERVETTRIDGELFYEISNSGRSNTYLTQREMFHLHGLGFDGTVGYSVVSLAARSIGLSISLEEFGAQFFGNGATLGGIIEIPGSAALDEEGKKNLKKTFNERHQGPSRAHNVEILDADMKYKELGIEPDKGQFIESRQHQIEEVCRWFRVSPQKIAHLLRMTFNNVEQLSIDHVQDTLVPWITRLEQEANYKLFSPRNNIQYTKINTNALLRGDAASRTTFYRELWNLGVLSPNEIRELEDRNPVQDGDKRFVQMNMTTLEKAGEDPPPLDEPEEEENEIENSISKAIQKEMSYVNSLRSKYADHHSFVAWIDGPGRKGSFNSVSDSIPKDKHDIYLKTTRMPLFNVFNGDRIDFKQLAREINA